MEPFSVEDLHGAFRELSQELARRKVQAHIYVIGGAAMALGFESRRLTYDVDALIRGARGPVTDAVRSVGRRHGWSETWLNEQAVPSIPRGTDGRARTGYGDRNLVVTAASADHMLAMKVRSGRIKDYDDILFLVDFLGFKSAGEVFDLHDRVFPQDPPPEDSFKNVCKLLQNTWPKDRSLEGRSLYGYAIPGSSNER